MDGAGVASEQPGGKGNHLSTSHCTNGVCAPNVGLAAQLREGYPALPRKRTGVERRACGYEYGEEKSCGTTRSQQGEHTRATASVCLPAVPGNRASHREGTGLVGRVSAAHGGRTGTNGRQGGKGTASIRPYPHRLQSSPSPVRFARRASARLNVHKCRNRRIHDDDDGWDGFWPRVCLTRACVCVRLCVYVCVYWCADCNDDDIHSAVRVRFVRFSGRILLHGPFRWCGVLDVRACVCVCIAVAAVPAFVGHTGCWQAVGIRVLLLWCFPNIRTTTTTTRRIREVEAIFECFECLVCVLAARSSPATPRTPTRRVCLCNTTCRRRRRPTTAVGWTVPRVALERARVSACVCMCRCDGGKVGRAAATFVASYRPGTPSHPSA